MVVGIVVGAGIIGMTCAITLQSINHNVIVISKDFGDNLVSAQAGGLWEPYTVNPQHIVSDLAKTTLETWIKQIKYNNNINLCKVSYEKTIPIPEDFLWWKDMCTIIEDRWVTDEIKLVSVLSPIICTSKYLQYLYNEFMKNNGKMITDTVSCLLSTKRQYNADYIINCTGIGSRELLNDNLMKGIGGIIVYLQPNININCMNYSDTITYNNREISIYIIPRSDAIIIGGTNEDEDLPIDDNITNYLISQASKLYDKRIQTLPIQKCVKEIRPYRKELRLELEIKEGEYIIHNYGHGGSGWTLCWGCAYKVRDIVLTLPRSKI